MNAFMEYLFKITKYSSMKTFLMAIYVNLALCYLAWTQIPSSYKMNRFKYAFSKQNKYLLYIYFRTFEKTSTNGG